ncbi:MAG: hypothetical protein ACR2NB_09875 [Solirubrobacteraceae bacterium]
MRIRSVLAPAAAVLAIAVAGCGSSSSSSSSPAASPGAGQAKAVNPNGPEVNPAGDIPDNQAYVAYSPPGGAYSVKVPEGWARTAAGGAVTFTDKLNSVRMEALPARAALTAADATSTVVPKLAGSVPHFKLDKVSTVSRTAGPAIRITYAAQSPADPVTGKTRTTAVERYAFFHKGRNVVLTLSGPKGADNVDPWKIVTDSLRFMR